MKQITLGLLDLGYRETKNSLTIVQEVMDYAVFADKLNFKRFWLAEHHNPNRLIAFTNPEIIIALIAGITEEIRVGSAGTLLKMHECYDTATTFKILNNLFNDRIDLGLSKGEPGSITLKNKIDDSNCTLFDNKVDELCSLLSNDEANFLDNEIVIPPYLGSIPQLWYLSNSYSKFGQALKYKLNYCRSLIHGTGLFNKNYHTKDLLQFKQQYFEDHKCYPIVSLAVGLILDKNFGKAQKKYKDLFDRSAKVNSSSLEALPVTPSILFDLINEYEFLYGVDEFILYDMEGNNDKKIENLQLINEAFGLAKIKQYEKEL